jgi:hypothetical protein
MRLNLLQPTLRALRRNLPKSLPSSKSGGRPDVLNAARIGLVVRIVHNRKRTRKRM